MSMVIEKSSGKSYEREVMRYLTYYDPRVCFDLDVRLPDSTNRHFRQVDVWLPRTREVIECKHHARPVDVGRRPRP
jgi:hypothetical protein